MSALNEETQNSFLRIDGVHRVHRLSEHRVLVWHTITDVNAQAELLSLIKERLPDRLVVLLERLDLHSQSLAQRVKKAATFFGMHGIHGLRVNNQMLTVYYDGQKPLGQNAIEDLHLAAGTVGVEVIAAKRDRIALHAN